MPQPSEKIFEYRRLALAGSRSESSNTSEHGMHQMTRLALFMLIYDRTPETQDPSNLLRAFIKQLCFRKDLDPLLLMSILVTPEYHSLRTSNRISIGWQNYLQSFYCD